MWYTGFDGRRWLLWYDGRRGGSEQIGLVTNPNARIFPD